MKRHERLAILFPNILLLLLGRFEDWDDVPIRHAMRTPCCRAKSTDSLHDWSESPNCSSELPQPANDSPSAIMPASNRAETHGRIH